MLWTGKSGKMRSVTVSESLDYIVNSKIIKACNSPCLERWVIVDGYVSENLGYKHPYSDISLQDTLSGAWACDRH